MPAGVPAHPHHLATVDSDQLRREYPRPHSFLALTLIVSVFTTLLQPPTLFCTIPAIVMAVLVSVSSDSVHFAHACEIAELPVGRGGPLAKMITRGFVFSTMVSA